MSDLSPTLRTTPNALRVACPSCGAGLLAGRSPADPTPPPSLPGGRPWAHCPSCGHQCAGPKV